MPAQIGRGVVGPQSPDFGVLSQKIVDAPGLAGPLPVLPGTANRGDIFEPWCVGGKAVKFLAIAEFERTAGTLETEKPVFSARRTRATFPIAIERARVADERGDAGNGRNKQVVRVAGLQIQQEAALSDFAAEQRVPRLQLEKTGRQATVGDELDKELKRLFVRGGNQRVGALGSSAIVLEAESGVLSRAVFEWSAGINAQNAQVLRKVAAIENSRGVVFIR